MMSVTGKGYSNTYTKNPFQEDPLPKAFYYPTQQKELSEGEKQVSLSPCRGGDSRQTVAPGPDKAFLASCHSVRPLPTTQNYLPASPDSSQFAESWPDSERPSPCASGEGLDLPFANVRRHVTPTFTSSPVAADNQPVHAGRSMRDEKQRGYEGGKTTKPTQQEQGSVLQKYIERFRHGAPTSREERQREDGGRRDFWWLKHGDRSPVSPVSPQSSSCPPSRPSAPGGQGRGTLTVENLRRRDELDAETAKLQARTERLLRSAGSLGSGEPAVSTEGLGSTGSDVTRLTGSDVTGSSFSEPAVRPAIVTYDSEWRPGPGGPSAKGQRSPADQKDILYRWRLQRKLEAARDTPYVPTATAPSLAPKTQAEAEAHGRLTAFREKLQLQASSLATVQLQEARVEREMKQIQRVMDTGVQTSPLRSTPAPCLQPHPSPRPWPRDGRVAETDPPRVPVWGEPSSPTLTQPAHLGSEVNLGKVGRVSEVSKDYEVIKVTKDYDVIKVTEDKVSKDNEVTNDNEVTKLDEVGDSGVILPSHGGTDGSGLDGEKGLQYRQFLQAEKPHVHAESGQAPDQVIAESGHARPARNTEGVHSGSVGSTERVNVGSVGSVHDGGDSQVEGHRIQQACSPTPDPCPAPCERGGGDARRTEKGRGHSSSHTPGHAHTSLPPPIHSSSPARPGLGSAITQVVNQRLFDVGSLVSSVDSLASIPGMSAHFSEPESDGEFEDDRFLQVLRQQRQQHEATLRLLDAILAERPPS